MSQPSRPARRTTRLNQAAQTPDVAPGEGWSPGVDDVLHAVVGVVQPAPSRGTHLQISDQLSVGRRGLPQCDSAIGGVRGGVGLHGPYERAVHDRVDAQGASVSDVALRLGGTRPQMSRASRPGPARRRWRSPVRPPAGLATGERLVKPSPRGSRGQDMAPAHRLRKRPASDGRSLQRSGDRRQTVRGVGEVADGVELPAMPRLELLPNERWWKVQSTPMPDDDGVRSAAVQRSRLCPRPLPTIDAFDIVIFDRSLPVALSPRFPRWGRT